MYINKYDERWWCLFYKADDNDDVYLNYGDVYLYFVMKIVTFNYGDDKGDVYLIMVMINVIIMVMIWSH